MVHNMNPRQTGTLSRRRFLQAGAAFGGGLMIGWVEAANA